MRFNLVLPAFVLCFSAHSAVAQGAAPLEPGAAEPSGSGAFFSVLRQAPEHDFCALGKAFAASVKALEVDGYKYLRSDKQESAGTPGRAPVFKLSAAYGKDCLPQQEALCPKQVIFDVLVNTESVNDVTRYCVFKIDMKPFYPRGRSSTGG